MQFTIWDAASLGRDFEKTAAPFWYFFKFLNISLMTFIKVFAFVSSCLRTLADPADINIRAFLPCSPPAAIGSGIRIEAFFRMPKSQTVFAPEREITRSLFLKNAPIFSESI